MTQFPGVVEGPHPILDTGLELGRVPACVPAIAILKALAPYADLRPRADWEREMVEAVRAEIRELRPLAVSVRTLEGELYARAGAA